MATDDAKNGIVEQLRRVRTHGRFVRRPADAPTIEVYELLFARVRGRAGHKPPGRLTRIAKALGLRRR